LAFGFGDTGLGRKVIANQHLQGLARDEQLQVFCFYSSEKKTFALPIPSTLCKRVPSL
jgi:hypothetical protein